MPYETLSLSSFIKSEMKDNTYATHPRKFCFVLGAGASRSSGIKSGQELVRIWDGELQDRNKEEYSRWRNELGITDANMSEFYSQYYDKRFRRCPEDGYNYIEKIMEHAKPSAGYVMLAHMLTHTPNNVVITTNFDHLTEDAVNYYAQSIPLVVGHEFLAHYVPENPRRATIIKIHRDLLLAPKSESKDLEMLPESWKTALGKIFQNYHPVFIGYAGNDKSVMDFLLETADKFKSGEWKFPYWLVYKGDKIEGKIKDFLDKSDGYAIRHSGFDDVMILMGKEFGYKLPTEEDFLKDGKRRFGALTDAINALSSPEKPLPSEKEENTPEKKEPAAKSPEGSEESDTEVNQAIDAIVSQSDRLSMFREATTLMRAEQYTSAVPILQQLTELEPENALYFSEYGGALLSIGETEKGLEAYRKTTELEPGNPGYCLSYANSLKRRGRTVEAREEYLRGLKLNPDYELLHFYFAQHLEHREGQYESALVEYQKALSLRNDSFNNYKVAEMLHKLARDKEALPFIQEAIHLDSSEHNYYLLLAEIREAQGKSALAKSAREKAQALQK